MTQKDAGKWINSIATVVLAFHDPLTALCLAGLRVGFYLTDDTEGK